jgi:hypothetical protein
MFSLQSTCQLKGKLSTRNFSSSLSANLAFAWRSNGLTMSQETALLVGKSAKICTSLVSDIIFPCLRLPYFNALLLFPTKTPTHLVEDSFLSPMRESVSLHNDDSERILFDEQPTPEPPLSTPLLAATSSQFTSRTSGTRSQRPRLNGLNILNLLTYILHLFVNWGVGVWGLGGILDNRWKIAMEHETLITPALWTYYGMWYPILSLEAIFALAQLFPYFRARPIVQEGTGYFFFYTFVIQTIWTIAMAFHLFAISFIAVVLALLSLVCLLQSQQLISSRSSSSTRRQYLEYYLFQFPFFWHTGWMFVVTAHHFSLVFRSYECNASLQLAVDMVSLAWLLPVSVYYLIASERRQADFVIPIVIFVSYIGIATRLEHPSTTMIDIFGKEQIAALKIATYFFAGTVGVWLVPNCVIWIFQEFCTITVVEVDE